MRTALFPALTLLATAPSFAAETPPAPARLSLAEMLPKFAGKWVGEQIMRNPAGETMTMRVTEVYTWKEAAGKEPAHLCGELVYTVGSEAKTRTFKGFSKTWVDATGAGHAEIIEGERTIKYIAVVKDDTILFFPAGSGSNPSNATSVKISGEPGSELLEVRGFQNSPKGAYLVTGMLKREAK